jgi:hypothetical protein
MEIDILGKSLIDEIKNNLIREGKISSGRLLNSLSYNTIQSIEGWTIEILAEKYLEYVDQGRKPGRMPPVSEIQKWVIQKPIKFIGKTDKQTAFIIARSIGKKGIVPTNIIQKSISKVLDNIEKIIKIEKLYQ